MWEMCRDRIVAMGNRVLLAHRMKDIELRDGSVAAVRVATPHGERRIQADHLISSAPLRSLVHALGPGTPADVCAAARGLRYRDFVVVALILARERLFPDNWIYVHTPGVRVGRIQNFNNWSAAMVPDPSTTCLGLEYFCFQGDTLWESRDDALVAQASRELEQLGPKAYPIYDGMYRQHLSTIRRFIDPIPNLHTVGRNGMHKYNNQDHSMLTAMMAVWNMQGATHDTWEVNTDFEYLETQKIDSPTLPAAPARVKCA
jgi:protoporphyrinogen oxidase